MRLITAVFQVTTKCPYNCPQCYMKKGNEDLPLEVGMRVIDQLLPLGLQAVQITGGEPLAYAPLAELIQYAHGKGLMTFLATSGFRNSLEQYRRLKQCGLDILCVSLNAIDQSVDQLTRDTFEEALVALRDAVDVGLPCVVNTVVSDENVERLELLAHYAKRKGAQCVDVLRPVPSHDGVYRPTVSQETVAHIADVVRRNPSLVCVESCFKEYWSFVNGKPFCCRDAGCTGVFVNADGSFSPCSNLQQFRYPSYRELVDHRSEWKGGCP